MYSRYSTGLYPIDLWSIEVFFNRQQKKIDTQRQQTLTFTYFPFPQVSPTGNARGLSQKWRMCWDLPRKSWEWSKHKSTMVTTQQILTIIQTPRMDSARATYLECIVCVYPLHQVLRKRRLWVTIIATACETTSAQRMNCSC